MLYSRRAKIISLANGRAILIEVRRNIDPSGLEELRLLAEAAGYSVLNTYEQTRFVDSAYCLGRGRAESIAKEIEELHPDKVIFNNTLKPSQKYNLTHLFKTEVIDRFQLILEIFTKRAGTIEAKYQIELATLQYALPNAKENVHLARLGELPGFHGLGKYQADVYTTMIKRRISHLKRRLREISTQKSMHRKERRKESLFTIALTGYTFAGKTTLFNHLTKESLPIGSNLFTTLSTTTRAIQVRNRKVLISDTVGFIDNLPHLLVDAFYSTLEEVTLADVVLLIMDSSDSLPEFTRKAETCLSTLISIGVSKKSIVPVLNKIDASPNLDPIRRTVNELVGMSAIEISARDGAGISDLTSHLGGLLPEYERYVVRMPASANPQSILSWAHEEADIKALRKSPQIEIELEMIPSFLPKLRQLTYGIEGVEILSMKGANMRRELKS